jgi:triacylglycerol lipase
MRATQGRLCAVWHADRVGHRDLLNLLGSSACLIAGMNPTHWERGTYSPAAAYWLCQCSDQSYQAEDVAVAYYARHGFDMQRITRGHLSVDVARKGNTLIVAFAGTNDIDDWLTNLSVGKDDWRGYQLHSGFHAGEESLTAGGADLFGADIASVWVTGHSMGGALASLFALRIVDGLCGEVLSGCYTYGSPRCMDRRSAEMFDLLAFDRHYRHVNGNDIVPRVPSCLRFRHSGNHVRINRHGDVIHNPSPFYSLYDRVLGYRADLVRNHFVDKYLTPLLWRDVESVI